MLKEHERKIQQAVRKARLDKVKTNKSQELEIAQFESLLIPGMNGSSDVWAMTFSAYGKAIVRKAISKGIVGVDPSEDRIEDRLMLVGFWFAHMLTVQAAEITPEIIAKWDLRYSQHLNMCAIINLSQSQVFMLLASWESERLLTLDKLQYHQEFH